MNDLLQAAVDAHIKLEDGEGLSTYTVFKFGAQWLAQRLNEEIQNNLCAVSGMADEYAHGYENCGIAIIEFMSKLMETNE